MTPENPTPEPPRYERPDRGGMHEVTKSFEQAQVVYAEVKKLSDEDFRAEMSQRHDQHFKIILALAFVAMAGAAAWYFASTQQPIPIASEAVVEPIGTKTDEQLSAEAHTALAGFFGASDASARRNFILEPERVGPIMEHYYANGGKDLPNGAAAFSRVPGLTEDDRARGVLLMEAPMGAGENQSLVVYLKKMGDTWRLDWETYVQNKDLVLVNFFNTSTHAPVLARAGLRRVHVFGSASMKEALHVIQLDGWEFSEDVIPTPEVAARIHADLPWSARRRAVMTLVWEPDATGKPRVICKELKSWDFAP